jgi:hypothetical protein
MPLGARSMPHIPALEPMAGYILDGYDTYATIGGPFQLLTTEQKQWVSNQRHFMRFAPKRMVSWPRSRVRRFIFSIVSDTPEEGMGVCSPLEAAASEEELPRKDGFVCDSARASNVYKKQGISAKPVKQVDEEEARLPRTRAILRQDSMRPPRRLRAVLFEVFIDLCIFCNFALLAAQHYKQGDGWDKASD